MSNDKYVNRENVKTVAKIVIAIILAIIFWKLELFLLSFLPWMSSIGTAIVAVVMAVVALTAGAGLSSFIVKKVASSL